MVRSDELRKPEVHFRNFWGITKRQELLKSLTTEHFDAQYQTVHPNKENRYSFCPGTVTEQYQKWPRVTDLCLVPPHNGPVERRGMALIAIDRVELIARMKAYFDSDVTDTEVKQMYPSLMMTGNRIVGPEARKKLLKSSRFDERRIVKYPFKPFDVRWCYLDNIRPLFSEPSPQLLAQRIIKDNGFFLTRDTADKTIEGVPFYMSPLIVDYDFISGHSRHFPFVIVESAMEYTEQMEIVGIKSGGTVVRPNLSKHTRSYCKDIGVNADERGLSRSIWLHVLAIGYAPAYLEENADGIRQDWPRIPLPSSPEQFRASAALGKQVADLLDTEQGTPGVTAGAIRHELRGVASLRRVDGKPFDASKDLKLEAGWGHAGKDGITMPGRGKLFRRERSARERSELAQGLAALGISEDVALARLGASVVDVYLNDRCAWTNVPEKVWEFYIGGYQVMKKWLSYREHGFLKRPLTTEEAAEVQAMAQRLTALCLLQPELDANYLKVKSATWQGRSTPTAP